MKPAAGWLWLLAAVLGATPAFAAPASEGAVADLSNPGWIDHLRALASGDPLLVVITKRGAVVGQTPNGKAQLELVGASKQPREALLDGARELLWFWEASRLYVVDLRAKTPTPSLIVQGLPKGAHVEIASGADGEAPPLERPSACESQGRIQILWSPSPRVEVTIEGTSHAKLVGAKWLKDNMDRSSAVASPLVDFWTVEAPQREVLPKGLSTCSGAETCGVALPFGQAGWRLILTGVEEGADCRHLTCVLLDPTRKKFAAPTNPGVWKPASQTRPSVCGPFYFDTTGDRYVTGRQVCTIGPQAGCTTLDGTALGWLPPGVAIGAPG